MKTQMLKEDHDELLEAAAAGGTFQADGSTEPVIVRVNLKAPATILMVR